MRKFAVIVCLAGVFSLRGLAESSLGLIQPDAGLVFGIEWRKIVESSVGEMLTEHLKKSELTKIPGFESVESALLHDLDSVLIASPAGGLSKRTTQPPVLVVVKGRFKVDQLRGLVLSKGQSVETYRGVELLSGPATPPAAGTKAGAYPTRVAFFDANTILAGDRAEVRAAIDRLKTGNLTEPNRGILAGVSELASQNDLWRSVEIPADALKDAPPAAAQMFSGVKSAELGMSFGQGFGLQVNVRTKDDASAQSMAQTLQGLIAMAAMSQSESPQSAEMVKKVKITSQGSRVKLALALDRSELEKIIKETQNSRRVASTPKETPTRAPEPAGPKTVRIIGLDSGPVEVPFSETKR
jgi:hypothetical protein